MKPITRRLVELVPIDSYPAFAWCPVQCVGPTMRSDTILAGCCAVQGSIAKLAYLKSDSDYDGVRTMLKRLKA